MQRVVVLGSTGSIGTQALEVARASGEPLRVVALAAGGQRPELLASQALEHHVEAIAVARASAAGDVQLALYAEAQRRGFAEGRYALPKLLTGPDAATELAGWPCDVVLNAITGSIGLAPSVAALKAGRRLALANKESLVAGGGLVRSLAAPGQLVPVDSEHSALAQALRSGARGEVARLVLTASGGPFRGRRRSSLEGVTPQEALAHPTWEMGPVVTINSATLVNKGLELIEAHELFAAEYGLSWGDLQVVVHPESIVHSLVTFRDGSSVAQASYPDMRIPIAYALTWPARASGAGSSAALRWDVATRWSFEPVDNATFPAIELARRAGETGGCHGALYNAANEEAVAAFRAHELPFLGIARVITRVLEAAPPEFQAPPGSVEEVTAAEDWARHTAQQLIAGGQNKGAPRQ
jgi:1-deoxy-D-xylulose-5-phosphate reductoisomerase